jgi:hypothetical protein
MHRQNRPLSLPCFSALRPYPFRGSFLGDGRAFLDLLLGTKEHEPAAVRARCENERIVARKRAHDLGSDEVFLAVRREREIGLAATASAEVERKTITRTAMRKIFSVDDAADDEVELLQAPSLHRYSLTERGGFFESRREFRDRCEASTRPRR